MAQVRHKIDYGWRVIATGFGFLLFSCMGLLFRIIVCPFLSIKYRSDARKKELTARKIVQKSFAFFLAVMEFLGPLKLTVNNRDRLSQSGLLICPSHPTLIDVVILMSMISNANCLVKAKLLASPVLNSPISTSGYIANDSGPELIDACAKALAQTDSLIIFPEGTRTTPGQAPHLKHGAAATALASRCNITPVKITCEPPALMKGIHWYTIPSRRMHISVTVCSPIEISPFLEIEATSGRPKAIRRLTEELTLKLFPEFSNSNNCEQRNTD